MRWLRRIATVLLLAIVLAAGLLFSLQNADTVPVDLLVYQTVERPVSVWLLVAFALGGLVGLVVGSAALVRVQASRLRLRRQLETCEKELAQLKVLPHRG
jgi:lipopolysaccharide assembly protein A